MIDAFEEWRPVLGWEGLYEVSSIGRVRSLERQVVRRGQGSYMIPTRVLKMSPNTVSGYMQIGLSKDSRHLTCRVHALVCEAFHGPKPFPDAEIRHLNGDCVDNRPENLAWGTRLENMADMTIHGRNSRTNRTHCPQGHPYDAVNTYRIPSSNRRVCRECKRVANRRAKAKAKRLAQISEAA